MHVDPICYLDFDLDQHSRIAYSITDKSLFLPEVCPAVTHMLNPLARAVCHLSFACLLTIRPNRASKPFTAHHRLGSANRVFSSTSRGTSGGNRQLTVSHNHTRVKAMQTQSWQYPTPLYFESKTKHTATVIILHGLGDTANGWSSFGPMLQMKLPHVKFVFPTAPTVSQSLLVHGSSRSTAVWLHLWPIISIIAEAHHLEWWHEDDRLV